MEDERSRRPATFALGAGIAAALVAGSGPEAGQSYARLSVSAVVAPQASVAIRSQPVALTVSAADVARGFVEAAFPTELEVHSNSRDGYVLAVAAGLPGVTRVEIEGLGSRVALDGEGGSIVEHWTTAERRAYITLRFRFALAPTLAPGVYPWPLHLSATPL